jgi:hypothetical protein
MIAVDDTPTIHVELEERQMERYRAWIPKHLGVCVRPDMVGTWMRWVITPSGLGSGVEAVCIGCEGKVDLTIGDDGEFCTP